jgi:sn-glycerol 3-phosphate transport system ATP-binding protein
MRREIRALQQKLGITMVYVTHDQSEAMSMADQVILMREGRVEQAAPPDELYARPATTFAARFIGTPPMSILPAPDRDDLLFGVRPEDVILGDVGLPVRVQNSEFLGADTVVTCAHGNQTLTARVPGKAVFAAGATIHARWRAEHVHVFDAASGARREDVSAPAAADMIGLVQDYA